MNTGNTRLRETPLAGSHRALGARMTGFAGWNMPVQYSGIIAEHLHTRARAGIFDISHMGEFIVKGPAAASDLERLFTRRVSGLKPGRCSYGFLLNENAGIIDDLIVFRLAGGEFMLVVNAATTDKDRAWIESRLSAGTTFRDISDETAKIDLQGPLAAQVMENILAAAEREKIRNLKRFHFAEVRLGGGPVLASRTGYTGEDGFELFMPSRAAPGVWDLLVRRPGVLPAGLGARDSLRLEKGLCLYGSDIDEEHSPVEANLERFVSLEKDFTGRPALEEKQKNRDSLPVLAAFVCESRRAARAHFQVRAGGRPAGTVTSACFSPSLKKGIGLCYLARPEARPGNRIALSNKEVEIFADIAALPLV